MNGFSLVFQAARKLSEYGIHFYKVFRVSNFACFLERNLVNYSAKVMFLISFLFLFTKAFFFFNGQYFVNQK